MNVKGKNTNENLFLNIVNTWISFPYLFVPVDTAIQSKTHLEDYKMFQNNRLLRLNVIMINLCFQSVYFILFLFNIYNFSCSSGSQFCRRKVLSLSSLSEDLLLLWVNHGCVQKQYM